MAKDAEKSRPFKAYHMMYVQQIKYLPAGNVDTLTDWIEKRLRPKEYAIIVHDKDPGEEPHIHCMLSFQNARSLNRVAKLLGERDSNTGRIKSERITKWTGESNNGFAYLIHVTAEAQKKGKYQYDPSEVKANFDYAARMEQIQSEIKAKKEEHCEKKKINDLLNLLYIGAITKKEVEQNLSGAEYAQYHRKIEDVWAKHLEKEAAKWREAKRVEGTEIKTIWIYGLSGTGKTSLAREYAKKSGEEYYISGSSRDIFQGYGGEHKIILDELRPESIPYHDLLRITDPHGIMEQVMAPSRYYDKALACDLIIITSPYNPLDFYKRIFGDSNQNIDKFGQLQRRIALTMKMESTRIIKVEFDFCKEEYEEIPGTGRQNPYSTQARQKPVKATADIYSKMLEGLPAV